MNVCAQQMLMSGAKRRGVQNFPGAMIATRDMLRSEVSDHKTGVRAERQNVAEGIANIPPFVVSLLILAVRCPFVTKLTV